MTALSGGRTVHLARLRDLSDPTQLSTVLGPVARVERTPIGRLGHSGATHERLQVQLQNGDRLALVLKRTQLSDDWTAFASGDGLGREVQLLRTSALGAVWDAFANPYVACAVEPDQIGLLMDDLSGHIWPDRVGVSAQRPILEPEEDAVLGALGRLHARYWQSEALTLPWLLQPPIRFNLMGPHASWRERLPHGHQISRGWAAALSHLPGPVAELLTTPPEQLFRRYADLPRTLLHGDAKVPNFALLPDGRVAAIDRGVGWRRSADDRGGLVPGDQRRPTRPPEGRGAGSLSTAPRS